MISFTPNWSSFGIDKELLKFEKDEIIKEELMFFSASPEDCLKLGGPITNHIVNKYLDPNKKWIIDSRVHMLMSGWIPCISGWHNDDIPRGGKFGQPYHNGLDIEYKAEHILVVLGKTSMTEFILPKQTLELSNPVGKERLYKDWNIEINNLIEKDEIKTTIIKSGEVIQFGEPDFHRGTFADRSSWRIFFRATTNTKREYAVDPIRKQVQVYMKELEAGW